MIIGEPSYGSTGQPYFYAFRTVSIVPDVAVPTTIENVRSGKDAALEKALERAR